MGIRALCAAAAVAVGMGSAAEAATVASYTFSVRYDGTSFNDVLVNALDHQETRTYNHVEAGDTSLGLKSRLFGTTAIGDVLQFVVQVVHPDIPIHEPWYGNGGRTPVCVLGSWDCTATNDTTLFSKGFRAAKDDDWSMIVSSEIGSTFDVSHWPKSLSHAIYTEDGKYLYSYRIESSQFTVLDVSLGIAPVPLPATAALLPIGIGALAMMRRRRRLA